MKLSTIETKLNEAMRRFDSAKNEDWRLTRDVDYHDRCASEIRKERQKSRNKKDRAEEAIKKYSAMLQAILDAAPP